MKNRLSPSSGRIFYLDIARTLAILSITLNHAVNRSYRNYHGQMDEFLSIPIWSTLLKTCVTVFSRVGVPLFLMITGVLILNKKFKTGGDIRRFYKQNLLSLFITAEIWYVLIYWYLTLFSPDSGSLHIGSTLVGMIETMLFQNQLTFDGMWYMPMILCVYLFLPYIAILKDRLVSDNRRVLFLPCAAIFTISMVMPFVSNLRLLLGMDGYTSGIELVNLPIFYYLYILIGYAVGQGTLRSWRTGSIAAVVTVSFLICCGFQFWAYSRPAEYLVAYDFPLMPLLTGFLFELIRRGAHFLKRLERPIRGISRISLGIYFLHMVIMTALTTLLKEYALPLSPPVRLLVLETGSLVLSILIILPFSKIKLFKKYLFLIK